MILYFVTGRLGQRSRPEKELEIFGHESAIDKREMGEGGYSWTGQTLANKEMQKFFFFISSSGGLAGIDYLVYGNLRTLNERE